jgi:hypothetical protein
MTSRALFTTTFTLCICLCLGPWPGMRPAAAREFASATISEPGRPALSIGQLIVPAIRYEKGYARHYEEQCSATLVADGQRPASRLLLSAWHCLEDHRDLSRPVLYQTGDGERLAAQVLASGGAMHADWVLLRLPRALPDPLPLLGGDGAVSGPLRMAGFPRDTAPRALTLSAGCRVTGEDGADLRTDCVLQKGASGGATLTADTPVALVGVISRGDGVTQSIFVPVARFYPRIRPFLEDDSGRTATPAD